MWKGQAVEKRVGHGDSFVEQDSFVIRHSFVVRIWREEGQSAWRGWVQHAGTGESTFVQSLDELLVFIECRASKLAGTGGEKLK